MDSTRTVRGWGVSAVVAVAVATLARTIALVQSAWTFYAVDRTKIGAAGIEQVKTAIVEVLVATALVVLAGIVVVIWLFLARTNAGHVPGPSPRWARGWSIGAWFVPLASLVLVPLVVADVWRSSSRSGRPPVAVALWWTSVVAAVVLNATANLTRAAPGQSGELTAAVLQTSGACMEVVAGALLILVVLRISTWQHHAAGHGDGTLIATPPTPPTTRASSPPGPPDEAPASAEQSVATPAPRTSPWWWPGPLLIAVAVVMIALVAVWAPQPDRAPHVTSSATLVPPGSGIDQLVGLPAVSPDGRRAFVPMRNLSNVYAASLSVVDAIRGSAPRVTASIPLHGPAGDPVFTHDGSQLLVPRDDGVAVIDPSTNQFRTFIPGMTKAYRIAVAAGADRAVVSNDEGTLWILDTVTDTLIDSIPVGDESQGLAVSSDGRRVLLGRAVTKGVGAVEIYDLVGRRTIATVPAGWYPSSIALTPDDRRAYVTNIQNGTVTVVDTTVNAAVMTLQGCPGANNARLGLQTEVVEVSCTGSMPTTGEPDDEVLLLDTRSGTISTRVAIPGLHPSSAVQLDEYQSFISTAEAVYLVTS